METTISESNPNQPWWLDRVFWHKVERQLMNLIHFWRPFVTRNVFKPKLSSSFFGPTVSYLIIYIKKTTKHSEIQEKACPIRAGVCTERKLHSNWRSAADTPCLSPTVVAGLRVRYSWHRSSPETFLFGKFVHDERRSWTEVPLHTLVENQQMHQNDQFIVISIQTLYGGIVGCCDWEPRYQHISYLFSLSQSYSIGKYAMIVYDEKRVDVKNLISVRFMAGPAFMVYAATTMWWYHYNSLETRSGMGIFFWRGLCKEFFWQGGAGGWGQQIQLRTEGRENRW
jgi:hypothetical protein